MKRYREIAGDGGSDIADFLSSHPPTQERIDALAAD